MRLPPFAPSHPRLWPGEELTSQPSAAPQQSDALHNGKTGGTALSPREHAQLTQAQAAAPADDLDSTLPAKRPSVEPGPGQRLVQAR